MKQSLLLRSGALVLSVRLFVGCQGDAGWNYASEEGTPISEDGLRYQLPDAAAGVSTTVYGDAFGGRLRVEFKLTNMRTKSLGLGVREVSVHDAAGAVLMRVSQSMRRCEGAAMDGECTLPKGKSLYATETFKIRPYAEGLMGCFGARNSALEEVTVRMSVDVGSGKRPIRLDTRLVRVD